MRNLASGFLKQIITVIASIVKAKSSIALKSTKTGALRSRLVLLSLIRDKKVLLSAITHKLHVLVAGHQENDLYHESAEEKKQAIVIYNDNVNDEYNSNYHEYTMEEAYEEEEDEKYPDYTHSLFDDLDDDDDDDDVNGGSVIELMSHSKEEDGEEFVLEDEIDQVADLFIKKFHHNIKMQKQLSFKMYQEMLQRSV